MKHLLVITLISCSFLFSQEYPSIHQEELEYYRANPEMAVQRSVLPTTLQKDERLASSSPNAIVYGFHPYWKNGFEVYYYFNLLTHLAYFSADVDENTGGFTSTHNYSTAGVITAAKNAGVKVHLTITCFSGHATLFGNANSVRNLVNNILVKVKERNIDGVNLDFESVSSTHAAAYKNFILQLGDSLKKMNKELAVELFAVDWSNIFPASFFADVDHVVDLYFIMLYGYYWSGSSTAGPIAPLRSSTASGYHVLKSIDSYLAKGCPPKKLIAGFPYYGYDWPVVSSARMATATGKGSSRTYTVAKNSYLDTVKAENVFFDATYNTPWYRYNTATEWRQTWCDDSLSIAIKYDSVKAKNIAGVGMWALGYDGSDPELWRLLNAKFTTQTSVADESSLPQTYSLLQNYPNPFNPATTIDYAVPAASMVDITVYDMLGREVRTIEHRERMPGRYSVSFNAEGLSSGVYLYLLRSNDQRHQRKMVVLK